MVSDTTVSAVQYDLRMTDEKRDLQALLLIWISI